MRHLALAAAMLLALASSADAQALGGSRGDDETASASDSAWVPQSYGLAVTSTPGSAAVKSIATGSKSTTTPVVVKPEEPTSTPTMQWYWDKEMWCITTYAGWTNAWDAIQYQYCVGDACPAKRRGCYAPNAAGPGGGKLSIPADTIADNNNCLSENYCRGQYD